MLSHPFIAIEGAIGVGKTTLARILGDALGAEVLLEVFEENPFLGDFYADRARYAFQTQLFFLLSRYRQQHRVITDTVERVPLVSDYLFAKDWLFAHLNLSGDELAMYERVHSILGAQIPSPTLVVYLKASTDTLLRRITFRDRPYERRMSRDYIDALRVAYEEFFAGFTEAPLLTIDTEHLDYVGQPDIRAEVVARVKHALTVSAHQPTLPEIEITAQGALQRPEAGRRLPELQRLHRLRHPSRSSADDLLLDFVALAGRLGPIAQSLSEIHAEQDRLMAQVGNRVEARERAMEEASGPLQEALAGLMACLLRLANDTGVDLEGAYLRQLTLDPKPDA